LKELYRFVFSMLVQVKSLFGYPTNTLLNSDINYNEYWKTKRGDKLGALSEFQRKRADKVIPFLLDGDTVLDVGCGDGAILDYILKHVNIKAIGVDKSLESLNHVKSRGIETIHCDLAEAGALEKIPAVDYVLALEILEHMPAPELFLDALDSKVRKGFIVSFPNTGYWMHRFRLLFGRFPMQWRVHPGEHLRFWTIRDTKWWFKAMNRNIESLIAYEGVPYFNKLWPSMFAMGLVIKFCPRKL